LDNPVQLALNHLLRMVWSILLEISTSRLTKISALSGSSSLNGKPVMIACSGGFRIFFRLADVQFLTNIANVARVKRGGTKRIDFGASSMGCGSSATRGRPGGVGRREASTKPSAPAVSPSPC
jgi:hypothetical protein